MQTSAKPNRLLFWKNDSTLPFLQLYFCIGPATLSENIVTNKGSGFIFTKACRINNTYIVLGAPAPPARNVVMTIHVTNTNVPFEAKLWSFPSKMGYISNYWRYKGFGANKQNLSASATIELFSLYSLIWCVFGGFILWGPEWTGARRKTPSNILCCVRKVLFRFLCRSKRRFWVQEGHKGCYCRSYK